MLPGLALAGRLGVVQFANGSTTPTKIPAGLVVQAQAAVRKPGHVVLLRGGASPIGSPSYNFVLSGERTAAIRNDLVAAGIPRKKIVSQYVGVVNRGTPAADRAVIIDATTRAALGMAVPVPARTGEGAALASLEGQVQALEAAAHQAAAMSKVVSAKAKVRPFYTGGVWYATRNTAFNTTSSIYYGYTGGGTGVVSSGDNFQSTGYGFDLGGSDVDRGR